MSFPVQSKQAIKRKILQSLKAFSELFCKVKKHLSFDTIYIEYDETDCNGTKVHAMLVGGLSSSSYHAPYLIQIQTTHHAANAQFVQQFILSGLAKLGLMDDFNKVKLFLTDGAAYNIAASKLL